MPMVREPGRRIRFALAFILSFASVPAPAQYPAGATVQPLPRGDDPAELLARALRTLATEPNNLQALTTAGHNALVLGDPNAAVGFFGKAGELAPRDGHVKAGLGSALVQLEKPADALRLFGEASALGVADADLAEDRGLAYDLTGDNRRAQRDYAMVLTVHADDDAVRRRLALSQGIAGDKAAAIATLDPLIRRRDIAGWRAQTFVLAMNGDAAGASYITHIMMPQQADRMQPFLVRLATLSPADKARAVHFGEMPRAGSAYTPGQLASANTPATYAPAPPDTARAPSAATPVTAESRRETRVATAMPDDLAPAPEPAIAAGTPASPPRARPPQALPEPVPAAAPAPRPAPEQVAVATGAPAVEATRFIGPPVETVPKTESRTVTNSASAPSATGAQVAMASTPAPLAAMAFGAADAAPATPAPPAAATSPTPAPTIPAPAAAPSPAASAQASGDTLPAAGGPQLPVAAASGHYDLPHDAASAATPPAAKPAVREPPAAVILVSPKVPPKPRQTGDKTPVAGSAPAADAWETPKRRHPDHADDEASTAARIRGKAAGRTSRGDVGDEAAPRAKGTRASQFARAADAGMSDETPAPAKRASTRKGKADGAATTDDKSDDKTRGRKSGKASTVDGNSKRKGVKSDDGDTGTGTRKRGRSGDGGSKSDDRESAASKVYVQVAGGANRDDMDKAWESVKKKAPDLMKGRTASTTPLKATNRLLVGPFKSDDEAQAFVNRMAGKGLSGFTFKSTKGQKVEKVDSAR